MPLSSRVHENDLTSDCHILLDHIVDIRSEKKERLFVRFLFLSMPRDERPLVDRIFMQTRQLPSEMQPSILMFLHDYAAHSMIEPDRTDVKNQVLSHVETLPAADQRRFYRKHER